MFGLSGLNIYFIINIIYTIFQFIFLHSKIIHMTVQRGKKDIDDVRSSMPMYYILNACFGSLALLIDFLHCFVDPDCSLWLGKVKIKKEKTVNRF